jgi:hypothetical protein
VDDCAVLARVDVGDRDALLALGLFRANIGPSFPTFFEAGPPSAAAQRGPWRRWAPPSRPWLFRRLETSKSRPKPPPYWNSALVWFRFRQFDVFTLRAICVV